MASIALQHTSHHQYFPSSIDPWTTETDVTLHASRYLLPPPSAVPDGHIDSAFSNPPNQQPLPNDFFSDAANHVDSSVVHSADCFHDIDLNSAASLDNAFDVQDALAPGYFPTMTQFPVHQRASASEVGPCPVSDRSPNNDSAIVSDTSTPESLYVLESQVRTLRFNCSVCSKLFKRPCDLK